MKRIRVLALFVTLVAVVLLAAACGGPAATPTAAPKPTTPPAPAATPTAAAKAGGKLTLLCTPQPEFCEAVTKAFEAKTGIKVSWVRLSSGEALARVRAAKDNPEFSIWWGGPADSFIAAKQEGLLDKYVSPNADKIPANYKDADGSWAGIYVGSLGIASNTKILKEKGWTAPESWDDLLKPEYKGQVAIAHPASSGTAYTFLQTIIQLNNKDEAKAFEYFKKFHQNVFQYAKTGAGPATQVGQGEAAFGVVFSHDIVAAIEKGFPLQLTFPKEGVGYEIGAMAILKGAKELPEAKAFFDFALTKEAQEIGPTVQAYQGTTNPDAKQSRPELLKVKTINYDFAYAGANKARVVDKYTTEIAPAPK